jgi:hypothetical protein
MILEIMQGCILLPFAGEINYAEYFFNINIGGSVQYGH